MNEERTAEKDARRSTHDVYRVTAFGLEATPCFCLASSIHPIGHERVTPPE